MKAIQYSDCYSVPISRCRVALGLLLLSSSIHEKYPPGLLELHKKFVDVMWLRGSKCLFW